MKGVFIAVVTSLLLAGCGGPSPEQLQATIAAGVIATQQAQIVATGVAATQQAADLCGPAGLQAYADTMEKHIKAIREQTAVAGTTPRIGLGPQLQEFLDLQHRIEDVSHAPCVDAFHQSVVDLVTTYRESYQAFSIQEEQKSMNLTGEATARFDAVQGALKSLHEGKLPALQATPTPVR